MPAKTVLANADNLCRRYLAGESEFALAAAFNTGRGIVRRYLIEAGIQIRGLKDASATRYAKTTRAYRKKITAAAQVARRGQKESIELKTRRAIAREKLCLQSALEIWFGQQLTAAGIRFTPQKAVGIYNLDFALTKSSIAVEIFGGHWHAGGKHAAGFRKRCDYLFDSGWQVVVIWSNKYLGLLGSGAVAYVITLHKRLRISKAKPTKELVLGGTGKLIPTSRYDPNNGSTIKRCVGKYRVRGIDGRFTE